MQAIGGDGMGCPSCGAENPPANRFCGACGAALTPTCPSCGLRNPPTNRFCGECGARLSAEGTASPSPRAAPPVPAPAPEAYTPRHLAERILSARADLEGERKQVTVLFADIKGSTELIEGLDPEEAKALLEPAVRAMLDAVHRFEGTVCRVMGDGIMALFGAPLAHEDHAARACYAALTMQAAIRRYGEEARERDGVEVLARVGLNSGEVVVGAISNDLHVEYSAIGPTTHLAARMEQLAVPGTVRLTAATLRLVEGLVDVRPLGKIPVKGLGEPVEAFELVGAGSSRGRFQAAATRGLTPFVGRQAELEALQRALDLARAGHGQIVAPVGGPGVGKSRLFYEFVHSHRTEGWTILESGSVSYGKATAWLPVIDLLKAYCRVEPRDDPRAIREKVTGKLLALDRALEPILTPLLALLDLPIDDPAWEALDPPQRRRATLEALRRLLLRESQAQPLLLVFEDLHWIDAETQALLDTFVESLPTARILLLVNYRPEYTHTWANKSYYTQLRIDPLGQASAEEMLAALLGGDPSVQPLTALLIERTEGNPFFLEESARSLVETGALAGERGAYRLVQSVEGLRVPATVQAILAARIDRLPAEHKRLLQTAAVIGKDVPFALLRAIAELPDEALRGGLDHLQAAELLYETGLYPELEHTFKHALTHEVAYGSLLQERRRALHARLVEAIETLHRDRLDGEVERLAHHAVRGELREKAMHYLRQAGLKAAARSALQDARAWFEQALGLLEALPEDQSTLEQSFELRLELRPVLVQLGEVRRALEPLREAEALAERLNDDRRRGRVWAFMTITHSLLGELDEALLTGTRALAIAGRLGDLRLRISTTTYLEHAHYYRGEYERVVELATDNLAALPADWVYEYCGLAAPPSVWDRSWLVLSLAQLGRFAEAVEYEAEAIRLAEPTQHAFTVGLVQRAAGVLRLLKGDWAKARSLLEHGIAVFRMGNVVLMLPAAIASSAWALTQLGEASEALSRLQEGEQLLERQAASAIAGTRGWDYHALGRACLLLGRLDEARRLGDRAVEACPRQPGFVAHALHLLGDIATHPDRFDAERGEAHYRQALALAEPRGMRPLAAHCHLGLGKLYRQLGRLEEARTELSTASAMFREMEMTYWLQEGEAEAALR